MKTITLKKLAYVAPRPRYYRALLHRVLPTVEHRHAFKGLEFDAVLDIGANKGQFAAFAAARWPNAEIYCFEPYPPAADKLEALMGDRVTLYRTALGAHDGTQRLHVASADDSSSLLAMSETQKYFFSMQEVGQVDVPIARIDSLFPNGLPANSLFKIDVQGYESEVLKGAGQRLREAAAVYLEVSFIELYLGQSSTLQTQKLLGAYGFKKHSEWNTHILNGESAQADHLHLNPASTF